MGDDKSIIVPAVFNTRLAASAYRKGFMAGAADEQPNNPYKARASNFMAAAVRAYDSGYAAGRFTLRCAQKAKDGAE